MKAVFRQTAQSLGVWYKYVWQTKWRYLWILLVPVIIALLQWLLNIRLLVEILTSDSGLSLWQKIDVFGDSVGRVFTEIGDWTPISFILISTTQAAAIVLLVILKKEASLAKKYGAKQASSVGVAVVGAGCVACGGSLVTPLLGLLASNVSFALAEGIGSALLLISVIMSIYALNGVTKHPYFKVGR